MIAINNLDIIKGLAIAYDGCHKIYICEDEEDITNAKNANYEIHDMSELRNVYENSCSLRFINNWKLDKVFVEQNDTILLED